MITVRFYPVTEIADASLQFAVIVARQDGEWIFCRHQERSSWEIPGGHREEGEPILETAQRELYEETGALEYTLREVCVYGVDRDGAISYGLLCFAEIKTRGALPPETEIGQTARFQALPKTLTWPAICVL
jgi:8-oxo-dGTP diphosphatase